MTKILVLSSRNYPNSDIINYGDCILIDTDTDFIIYDCGSEKHAEEALTFMDKHGISSAKVILSHNDSDHFDGIPRLLASGKVSVIKTTLLLKYKDEILDRIDDGRKTRESVSKQILELYSNIATLSGAPIEDIYEHPEDLCPGVSIVGPDFDYMLNSVAKRLDGREGDTMDGETAVNATSIQVSVKFENNKVLLCGDCSFSSIEDKVREYNCIQLPHHGKPKKLNLSGMRNGIRQPIFISYLIIPVHQMAVRISSIPQGTESSTLKMVKFKSLLIHFLLLQLGLVEL